MSILGTRVLRKEDPKFLTTGGVYAADLRDPMLQGAGWVTFVRSTVAHARIVSIDTDDAKQAPGVLGVFTAADLGLTPAPYGLPLLNQAMLRTSLATDKVRFVGEPIVAIVTEHAYQGEDAVERVLIDYEVLPAVIDVFESRDGSTLLFEDVGTNVVIDGAMMGEQPPTADFFDGCEVVVTQRIVNQRVAPCPLEVRSGAAAWVDGRLVQWSSTQHAQGARDAIQAANGLEAGQVRVIAPDVGGGFGAKIGAYPEELLLGALAKHLGRPVRWLESRTESMQMLGHGRGQFQEVTIGGTRDGKVEAYRLEILQDSGGYPEIGAILPLFMTKMMGSAVYTVPKFECTTKAVVTNSTPIVAYRGAGRPEATAAMERILDVYAAEIGMDPAEVRRKNLIPNESWPYTTVSGATYDIGDYEGALDKVLAAADYSGLRAEQASRRATGGPKHLGIGVSVYVEITGGAPPPFEHARIVVHPNGGATVYTGTSPHGQGHATAWSMIAHEETGIPIELIEVIHGDTDLVPAGGGTMGSRSLQQGGAAVQQASIDLVARAREVAAQLLEANPDDLVLDKGAGAFHVAGTPASAKTWGELSVAANQQGNPLDLPAVFTAPSPTFPFGAHIAVVEVDVDTGQVRLLRHIACDDAGKVLNPMLLEGQVHGGIAQGAAQALFEEVRYDEDGNPVTANLADYAFPSAAELPSFEVIHMETPTPVNPLGAKGVGESGTIGSTPAVQNAVIDAVAHLGVRHIDMPASAEKVWRAIAAAR